MVTVIICLACLLFSSCSYGLDEAFYRQSPVANRANTIYELSAQEAPQISGDEYTIAIFSDIHFGNSSKTRHEEDFLTWLKQLKTQDKLPAFCICLGDIADHGKESEFIEYEAFVAKIEEILGQGKVYGVLGNHDLYNTGWNAYKKHVFPYKSLYHFKTQSFSWYCIDSASGSLGKKQYELLKKTFKNDDSPKIILSHIPVYGNPLNNMGYFTFQNSYEADMLLTLFVQNKVKALITGHIHRPNKNYFKDCMELTVAPITKDNKWTLLTINEKEQSIKEEFITN